MIKKPGKNQRIPTARMEVLDGITFREDYPLGSGVGGLGGSRPNVWAFSSSLRGDQPHPLERKKRVTPRVTAKTRQKKNSKKKYLTSWGVSQKSVRTNKS